MTDTINWADLANTKVGDVEAPTRIPDGHYVAMFSGLMSEHKAKSGNIAMRFPVKLIEPGSDVDAEALQAAGGVPDKSYSLDFWMSPDARFIFTEFGKSMGHSDDMNLMELAEALGTAGDTFVVEVKSTQDQNNPDRWYTNVQNAISATAWAAREEG